MLEYVNDLNSAKVGGPGLQRSPGEDPERTDVCTHPPTGDQERVPSAPPPSWLTALRSPGMKSGVCEPSFPSDGMGLERAFV